MGGSAHVKTAISTATLGRCNTAMSSVPINLVRSRTSTYGKLPSRRSTYHIARPNCVSPPGHNLGVWHRVNADDLDCGFAAPELADGEHPSGRVATYTHAQDVTAGRTPL